MKWHTHSEYSIVLHAQLYPWHLFVSSLHRTSEQSILIVTQCIWTHRWRPIILSLQTCLGFGPALSIVMGSGEFNLRNCPTQSISQVIWITLNMFYFLVWIKRKDNDIDPVVTSLLWHTCSLISCQPLCTYFVSWTLENMCDKIAFRTWISCV